jgi:hypothetical protein
MGLWFQSSGQFPCYVKKGRRANLIQRAQLSFSFKKEDLVEEVKLRGKLHQEKSLQTTCPRTSGQTIMK